MMINEVIGLKFMAGVDVGNSTTEVAIADIENGLNFVSSSLSKTTGIKGTLDNVVGILKSLTDA